MLILIKRYKGYKSLINLRRHDEFLFNGITVGLWTEKPYWKKGFCYQKVVWNDLKFHFIFKEFKPPFFFRKKKVLENLRKEFSFVKTFRTDFENLKVLKPIAEETYISFPKKGELSEGKNGVEFKTKNGETFYFLLGEGKPIPKDSYKSLVLPIPPFPCLIK